MDATLTFHTYHAVLDALAALEARTQHFSLFRFYLALLVDGAEDHQGVTKQALRSQVAPVKTDLKYDFNQLTDPSLAWLVQVERQGELYLRISDAFDEQMWQLGCGEPEIRRQLLAALDVFMQTLGPRINLHTVRYFVHMADADAANSGRLSIELIKLTDTSPTTQYKWVREYRGTRASFLYRDNDERLRLGKRGRKLVDSSVFGGLAPSNTAIPETVLWATEQRQKRQSVLADCPFRMRTSDRLRLCLRGFDALIDECTWHFIPTHIRVACLLEVAYNRPDVTYSRAMANTLGVKQVRLGTELKVISNRLAHNYPDTRFWLERGERNGSGFPYSPASEGEALLLRMGLAQRRDQRFFSQLLMNLYALEDNAFRLMPRRVQAILAVAESGTRGLGAEELKHILRTTNGNIDKVVVGITENVEKPDFPTHGYLRREERMGAFYYHLSDAGEQLLQALEIDWTWQPGTTQALYSVPDLPEYPWRQKHPGNVPAQAGPGQDTALYS